MCVVAFAHQCHPRYRLILAANRDEFHARASAPLSRWQQADDHILAGRDLVSGGTWLGVSQRGRVGVVTNVRSETAPDPAKMSRGDLVADYLRGLDTPAPDKLDGYNGFSLLTVGPEGARLATNRPAPASTLLNPGLHGLSNGIIGEPWPRRERLLTLFGRCLQESDTMQDALFALLADESIDDSIFIRNAIYGTRCSTIILIDHDGAGSIIEQTFSPNGAHQKKSEFYFKQDEQIGKIPSTQLATSQNPIRLSPMKTKGTTGQFRAFAALLAIATASLFSSPDIHAQTVAASEERPIPPLIPSEIFVDRGYFRSPIISPDGQRMVFRERIGKETYVGIKPVDGDAISRIAIPDKHTLNWYRWASDEWLLISINGIAEVFDMPMPISGLIAYNRVTQKSHKLGPQRQGIEGDDILYVDPNGEYLLMGMQRTIFDYPSVYRIRIADNELTEIVKPQNEVWEWLADDQGVVRIGLAHDRRATRIYYRRSNDAEFRLISKIKDNADDESKEESLLDISRIVSGKDEGYVLSNKGTGRFALYKFNYLTREIGELVFGHPENDISSFSLNADGTALESVRYTDSRDRIVWFDPILKKRQATLDSALPGQEAWIQSKSRDGSRFIVYTTSPTDPGSYALFEPKAGRLHRFAAVNDRIDTDLLATTEYVRYTARDGLEIPAYLTLPVGRKAQGLPLIILPHGGPYWVRDTLDYHTEVQFLANRGYAVLQPNFRGSDSYGEEFFKKGEGQIGRAMQDDLDDGMDWLVKQGIVDPARVCIVGASYGGYAAMWGIIRNPERYRCGASFAGVTDFKSQLKFDSKSLKSRYAREWRSKVQGEKDFDLDLVSPAQNAARLNRPLLLTHGDEDSTVPYSQFKKMVEALRKAKKPVESHSYEGEGHGFEDSANEKDWLDRLEAFLAKHNPADAPVAGR